MDLKTKLAFALVAASLLSMAALGYFTYLWAEDLFLADSRRQLVTLASSRQDAVEQIFADWQREVQSLVAHAEALAEEDAAPRERIAAELDQAAEASDGVRSVTLFGRRGKPLSKNSVADLSVAGMRLEPGGRPGVVFDAWITREGERVALLEAVFDSRPLERFVGPAAGIGATGRTLLVVPMHSEPSRTHSVNGYLLVGPSPSDVSETADAALRAAGEGFAERIDHRGNAVLAATRFLSGPGWGLVAQVDRAEAQERADQLLVNMRDLGVSLAAFAILGGTLFGLYLGRPIHKLVEELDRIRHGELGVRLAVEGEDEVAFLAQSLNEFMDQLDRSSDLFRLGELRVLVVDTDDHERRILHDLLVNWNMRPTAVESAAAASAVLAQASQAGQPVQLVVIEAALPGTDVAAWVEQLPSGTSVAPAVILLSEYASDLDAAELRSAGIGHVLPQPVVASHLMEAILDAMGVSAEGVAATADAYLKKIAPRKILLVEDSAIIQRVVMAFLEKWGHDVTLAENGRLALECLGREHFDLVLMDVEMPEMNGIEATAAIRERERQGHPRTRIVALTAEAMSGDRERCLAAGMDDYIRKPVDPKALYALIERTPPRAAR